MSKETTNEIIHDILKAKTCYSCRTCKLTYVNYYCQFRDCPYFLGYSQLRMGEMK